MFDDLAAALLRDIFAARDAARSLGDLLLCSGTREEDLRAAAVFEAAFHRVPFWADPGLPASAGRLYARLGRLDAALLFDGLAIQMQPDDPLLVDSYYRLRAYFTAHRRLPELTALERRMHVVLPGTVPITARRFPPAEPISEEGEAILASDNPGETLLRVLERLDAQQDTAGCARLFEAVWHRMPCCTQYWVFARMADAYDRLGRTDASLAMSMLTLQLDPAGDGFEGPARRLLRHFEASAAPPSAVMLVDRQRLFHPARTLVAPDRLEELRTLVGAALPPPRGARHDAVVFPAEHRPAQDWRRYGDAMPHALAELRSGRERPLVSVAELRDAELYVWRNQVAVFDAHGEAHPDLSVRSVPARLRRQMEEARFNGLAVADAELGLAVLLNDEHPPPNPCHFLLDHASRLLIYRAAGIDLAAASVIGPPPIAEYQHDVIARFGTAARWHGTEAPARLRVQRLLVSSNCQQLRHPAHWGAAWAIGGMRALFDLVPRAPARRLLVSRADVGRRQIANEGELSALLEQHDFQRIVPGQLSFAEQIAAFRDATHVVAPHGGALGNLLFCAPGTHVLEAFPPHYGTWAYAMISPGLGLDYATTVGRDALSDAPEFNDPALARRMSAAHSDRDFIVDLDLVRTWLRDTGVD